MFFQILKMHPVCKGLQMMSDVPRPTFKFHEDLPMEVLQVSPQLVAVTGFKLLLRTQGTRLPSR